MLEVGQPADHLAAEEAVSAEGVLLALLLREGFGLDEAPLEALARGDGDGVHEDGLVFGQVDVGAEQGDNLVIGGLAVRAGGIGRIGATDEQGESTGDFPRVGAERLRRSADVEDVASPALDGEGTGLKVHEQRGLGVERAGERRLADAAGPEQGDVDFRDGLEAVICLLDFYHGRFVGWEITWRRRPWVRSTRPCGRR